MTREGIQKGRASMSKTTRGKSNADTRLGEVIEGRRAKLINAMVCKGVVKMTSIEGQGCGVNGGQE